MLTNRTITHLLLPLVAASFLCSCNHIFQSNDYTAYFGGEIANPTNPYVMFCRNSKVIDSAKLDANNRFFFKFDSLTPGMYSYRNDPEYQYIYFEKNDSIMARINARDFDNSIVYCGRGDQKNNFLMDLYLKNEDDKSKIFDIFDESPEVFLRNIDSVYALRKSFYNKKKDNIKWGDDFDQYAQALLNFQHYSKKELYPNVHEVRSGKDVANQLPQNYYDFRKQIDLNNDQLSDFAPFITYLTHRLNNVAAIHYHNHYSEFDLALKTNINKLNIADTLIKNEKVKNIIFNNIAFTYLLEDQNMVNNKKFLDTYHKFSTDKSKKNEILKIGNAIQKLTEGDQLPAVMLVDAQGKSISSAQLATKKTVIFFWTENLISHLMAAHKKIHELKLIYPDYQFIGVCLDRDQSKWVNTLSKYKTDGIIEVRAQNFNDLREKWAITKVHRTIVLDRAGQIRNAFSNIFDVHFEENLKEASAVTKASANRQMHAIASR